MGSVTATSLQDSLSDHQIRRASAVVTPPTMTDFGFRPISERYVSWSKPDRNAS